MHMNTEERKNLNLSQPFVYSKIALRSHAFFLLPARFSKQREHQRKKSQKEFSISRKLSLEPLPFSVMSVLCVDPRVEEAVDIVQRNRAVQQRHIDIPLLAATSDLCFLFLRLRVGFLRHQKTNRTARTLLGGKGEREVKVNKKKLIL